MMADRLVHLWPAPIERKVEQLEADRRDSLAESLQKLLRLRSWIRRRNSDCVLKEDDARFKDSRVLLLARTLSACLIT